MYIICMTTIEKNEFTCKALELSENELKAVVLKLSEKLGSEQIIEIYNIIESRKRAAELKSGKKGINRAEAFCIRESLK